VLTIQQIYKDATLFFSQDSAATVAHVIPTMDRIDIVLHGTGDMSLTPSVKHALIFARKLLDKYYSKTDLSNVYRIAMGMWHNMLVFIVYKKWIHSSPSSNETQVLYAARLDKAVG
jgi:hypothetical protein